MSFSLPSFAKINWTLRVLGKRGDGFHELFTLFQTVSLSDTLSFAEAGYLELTCDDPSIPTDERNLILRTAHAMRDKFAVEKGAAIHLEKRIPSPGGLGGGSSNAAVALIGLNRLWDLDLPLYELHSIAEEIGSDVPFFLYGGTAMGTGRGELIEPIEDISAENMVIVTPPIAVSTAEAFYGLNAPALTIEERNRILPVCRSEALTLDPRRTALINDFEGMVFSAHPEIAWAKTALLELGAVNAAMSGSGASVFAIFDNIETRQTAMKALDQQSTWRKFAVATVSRDEYREALFQ
ncbi:MAG: 4-(cytidine 5'-diphospho)-2-C-methyl-D-erythritol kinase [Pyrinomonadaceae bacterium]